MRAQADAGLCAGNYLNWYDVPGIGRNDVNSEEINFGAGVRLDAGRFHLDAQESPSLLDHKVVAAAISPRLDDAKSMLGG